MSEALGLIETRGLVGAITAADAALKTAQVHLVGTERVDPAMILVSFVGNVAAVRAAVDAAAAAAEQVGELIAQHVIPRPHDDLRTIQDSHPAAADTVPPSHSLKDLERMTVVYLRRLARQTAGLSLHGRQISNAKREELIQELARVLQS